MTKQEYEFSGLKKDGDKTMVVFNKAGAEQLVVEASDYLYSQFKETNEIGYKPRIAATVAIIGADEPSFKIA